MDKTTLSRRMLEDAYKKFNHRRFVHPDPIEILYQCDKRDREVVALLAAALAYGRVAQILVSVREALRRLEDPFTVVETASIGELREAFQGFRHRFSSGDDVARMLFGVGCVVREFGSLAACFQSFSRQSDETVLPALTGLVRSVQEGAGGAVPFLLASPDRGSACKRLNLFLRWMVRRDNIDPGGWRGVPQSKLVVPLDTHMHRVGLEYGLTRRKSGDMKTALEITKGFKRFCPEDPVRYDFALTRMGILNNWRGDG